MASEAKRSLFLKVFVLAAAVLVVFIGMRMYFAASKAPLTDFKLLDGYSVNTESLRGNVVVVNFWSTTCPPCIAEMPRFTRAYERYHNQGLEIIAVAIRGDRINHVTNFVRARNLPFKVAFDTTGQVAHAWGGINVIPTTFILDRNGNIVHRFVGIVSQDELNRVIEQHL